MILHFNFSYLWEAILLKRCVQGHKVLVGSNLSVYL